MNRRSLTTALLASPLLLGLAAPPAAAAEITLKAGHSAAESEPYHIGLTKLADLVAEKTDGEVEIQVFPNSQLGNEKEMIEGVLLGTLDITCPANAVLTNFVEELKVFDLPFLFRDRGHMYEVLDGPVGEELAEAVGERGFHLLGFFEAGIRHIMTTGRPVESIDDLRGLKIRTMQNPAHVAAFNAFGANATPLAYGELYGALQSGVVDGAEAANSNYAAQKFYEVAPHWAMVAWTTLVAPCVMSEEKFQALPEDVQAALAEAMEEAETVERQAYAASDDRRFAELQAAGIEVTHPDPEPFRAASKAVYVQFMTSEGDRRRLEAILATE
jgi:tripartite ATP-independent transporter DctP family solute receptor